LTAPSSIAAAVAVAALAGPLTYDIDPDDSYPDTESIGMADCRSGAATV